MTIYQHQCLLGYLGYPVGVIDGIYGNATCKAVKLFQQAAGLPVSGVCDSATEKALLDAVSVGAVKPAEHAPEAAADNNVGSTGTFWDSIRHFSRAEFRCPCGKCNGFPVEPTEGIVRQAEALRDHLGVPVTIIPMSGDPHAGGSGVRCAAYNATFSNSASNSRHLEGKAVDFSAPAPASKIEAWLNAERSAGRLRYWYAITPTSWHMDIQ